MASDQTARIMQSTGGAAAGADSLDGDTPQTVHSLYGMSHVEHHFNDFDEGLLPIKKPTHPALLHAWALYHDAVKAHGLWHKSDLTLRDMAPFAHYLWLAEHKMPDDYFKIRVWSTGATEVTGLQMTGQHVDESGPIGKWPKVFRTALKERRPLAVHNRMSEAGKEFLSTEVAIIPMADKNDELRFLLCPFVIL